MTAPLSSIEGHGQSAALGLLIALVGLVAWMLKDANSNLANLVDDISDLNTRMAVLEQKVLIGMADRYPASAAIADFRRIDDRYNNLSARVNRLHRGAGE